MRNKFQFFTTFEPILVLDKYFHQVRKKRENYNIADITCDLDQLTDVSKAFDCLQPAIC